jgi:hypothetical protein
MAIGFKSLFIALVCVRLKTEIEKRKKAVRA